MVRWCIDGDGGSIYIGDIIEFNDNLGMSNAITREPENPPDK